MTTIDDDSNGEDDKMAELDELLQRFALGTEEPLDQAWTAGLTKLNNHRPIAPVVRLRHHRTRPIAIAILAGAAAGTIFIGVSASKPTAPNIASPQPTYITAASISTGIATPPSLTADTRTITEPRTSTSSPFEPVIARIGGIEPAPNNTAIDPGFPSLIMPPIFVSLADGTPVAITIQERTDATTIIEVGTGLPQLSPPDLYTGFLVPADGTADINIGQFPGGEAATLTAPTDMAKFSAFVVRSNPSSTVGGSPGSEVLRVDLRG